MLSYVAMGIQGKLQPFHGSWCNNTLHCVIIDWTKQKIIFKKKRLVNNSNYEIQYSSN